MSQATPALVSERRRNSALGLGAIVSLLGVASNFLYFVTLTGAAIFPWITIVVSAVGVILLLIGVKRAFGQPQIFRGKIAGSIITVLAVLFFALSTFGSFHARDIPASAGAPKVGQKAPDFAVTDLKGQPVTLSKLLSTPLEGKAPKAVLLVFYRGYW